MAAGAARKSFHPGERDGATRPKGWGATRTRQGGDNIVDGDGGLGRGGPLVKLLLPVRIHDAGLFVDQQGAIKFKGGGAAKGYNSLHKWLGLALAVDMGGKETDEIFAGTQEAQPVGEAGERAG